MPLQGNVREGDWTRLLVPVVVLVASVGACSAMRPADAGTPAAVCHSSSAQPWVGRAASADIVEQARRASGSESVHLVLPGEPAPGVERIDRVDLYLDARSIISKVTCG